MYLSLLSLCLCGKNGFAFAFSAARSLTSAATTQHRRRGGHMGANRGVQWHQPKQPPAICVDSAASPVLPACHFSDQRESFRADIVVTMS